MLIPIGFFGGAASGTFEHISTVDISSDVSTISFSSLPQTYSHLKVFVSAYSNKSYSDSTNYYLYFNGDASTNYISAGLGESGFTGNGNTNGIYAGQAVYWTGYGGDANARNHNYISEVTLVDYKSTAKWKSANYLEGGHIGEASYSVSSGGGIWKNTAAISSITIHQPNAAGSAFRAPTKISIFGVK
jgi:hypothetical protein